MRHLSDLTRLVTLLIVLTIFSCKGPEGPQGATGPTGSNGATGQAGPTGPVGTANVTYTEWETPTWSTFARSTDNSMVFFSLNATDSKKSILTQDAINKADIHVYSKTKQLEYDAAKAEYKLVDRISTNVSTSGYVKIPGKTGGAIADFVNVYSSYDLLGLNYFLPSVQLLTSRYDYTAQKYVNLPELVGKPDTDYRDMIKDAIQYRFIIIPGAVKATRSSAIDYSDYEAVKKEFGLKD